MAGLLSVRPIVGFNDERPVYFFIGLSHYSHETWGEVGETSAMTYTSEGTAEHCCSALYIDCRLWNIQSIQFDTS